MSAAPREATTAHAVRIGRADLDAVAQIEQRAYVFPWTPGNLRDSFEAGYPFHGLRVDGELVAYAIVMPGFEEAHLLNLTVAPARQGRGFGSRMLRLSMQHAQVELAARSLLLEVRPSNAVAIALYQSFGFHLIGRRRNYYPAPGGREDALVMRRSLP